MKKISLYLVLIVPFLAFIWVGYHWRADISLTNLLIILPFYFARGLGVTMGFHRRFTHNSFKTTKEIETALAIAGSCSIEGTPIVWVARHRAHHQHADKPGDPHSPLEGLWHAHFGFLLTEKDPDVNKYGQDLLKDPILVWVSKTFYFWVVVSLFLPPLISGLITWNLHEVGVAFLLNLAAIFILHHATWGINSLCHLSGRRPFKVDDQSTNRAFWALLSLGEGWHHNHHAFPTSPRHGLEWWEFDFTWLTIKFLEKFGLAWDLKEPSRETIDAKRVKFA